MIINKNICYFLHNVLKKSKKRSIINRYRNYEITKNDIFLQNILNFYGYIQNTFFYF